MNDRSDPSEPAPQRGWVWHCTDESIAADQISVLAILEVLFAVAAYWGLAFHFDWPWFSVLGLVAAPMLLLRSEESVALGVEILERRMCPPTNEFSKTTKWLVSLTTALLMLLANQGLTYGWLASQEGWGVYYLAAVLGMVLGAVWGTVIGWGSGMGTIEGAITGALMLLITTAYTSHVLPLIYALPYFLLSISAINMGMVTRCVFIRLFATLHRPLQGLRQMPRNWRENLLVIDLWHPPELLPKASSVKEILDIRGLRRRRVAERHLADKFAIDLLLPSYYLPALAYRWSIKASAWLWWPLALLLTRPFQGLSRAETRVKAAHLSNGAWAFPVLVPVVVLVWLVLAAWPSFSAWLELLPEIGKPAQVLTTLLTPPDFGIRYVLLWLVPLLALVMAWQRKNLQAAWSTPLGSPKDHNELSPEERALFDAHAARLDRLRLALIAALLLLGEAWAVAFFHTQNPPLAEHLFWPWLLDWL